MEDSFGCILQVSAPGVGRARRLRFLSRTAVTGDRSVSTSSAPDGNRSWLIVAVPFTRWTHVRQRLRTSSAHERLVGAAVL